MHGDSLLALHRLFLDTEEETARPDISCLARETGIPFEL